VISANSRSESVSPFARGAPQVGFEPREPADVAVVREHAPVLLERMNA
jgi:hypothetical protein